ncbi:MAG TPA: hypothetical protein P5081_12140 [Phycisphaerae bacterium]|nr:hypothetical protein [Phycisphaerae bacterium]HRW53626.1 hypothetical protein [Phycisphaerae bacterium]
MLSVIDRFGRLISGACDCPNCHSWCTRAERQAQRLEGLHMWVCPGCEAILQRSPVVLFARILSIAAFFICTPFALAIYAGTVNLSVDSEVMVILCIVGILLVIGLCCVVLPPLLLTILFQPAARIEFRHGTCRRCNYDLRGVNHGRCPECGAACLDVVLAYRRRTAAMAPPVIPVANAIEE